MGKSRQVAAKRRGSKAEAGFVRMRSLVKVTGERSLFDRFAGHVTRLAGSPGAFTIAMLSVVIWAVTGPMFRFSETWQMIINTGTTIITFLMVFLIQQSQNKDSLAVHIKLNELLASHDLASNRVVSVEDLDESELTVLREFYCELAGLAVKAGGMKESHSLDEAKTLHQRKITRRDAAGDGGILAHTDNAKTVTSPT